jgi:AraC-like DNA-binding protein
MAQVDVFSTGAFAPHRRIEYWNELVSETFTPQVIDARDRARFDGRLKRMSMHDLTVAEVNSDAAIIHHSKTHAASARAQEFFVELQLEGSSVITQDGREARLGPGDFTLCDTTRPYEVAFERPVSMLILGLPVTHLRRFVGYPEAITAVRMASGSGMSGLASVFLRDLWTELKMLRNTSIEAHMGDAMLNIIACAYASLPKACSNGATLATAQRLRIVRHIEEHLADSDLTPAKVANSCKVSARYAHRLFAAENETIRQYILRRRLEVCGQMLANPAQHGRSITAIATDMGFNSLAQFCTVFRERFGMTPGEYRVARHARGGIIPPTRALRRSIVSG